MFLELGSPELDAVLQMGPHQRRAEGKKNLPQPAGHTPPNAPQDAIGLLGSQGTLLVHSNQSLKMSMLKGLITVSRGDQHQLGDPQFQTNARLGVPAPRAAPLAGGHPGGTPPASSKSDEALAIAGAWRRPWKDSSLHPQTPTPPCFTATWQAPLSPPRPHPASGQAGEAAWV